MSDPILPGPVLGLSAAGPSAVGLARPGAPDRRLVHDQPRAHVESMLPLVERLLASEDLAPSDLAAIAVGRGPAPYTGLRIALATAQALGFALGRPVWGVSDLDVLAADAVSRLRLGSGVSLLAVLDAKRREVYWARYRVGASDRVDGLTRLEGPAVTDPALAPAASVVVGPGAEKHAERFGPIVGEGIGVDPALLARLAAARAAAGGDVSCQPLYLRRPDVAAPAAPKRATP
ncbi:MAG: tRNA (adenosine(37)-N6)-threonylcarbamoyltransferase complex dimerization subunit type 1 TsaB [Bifidobacteriaceae bacterium]|jgi:tRNA threonylcarbamoyladenosine biosynthesis protein TsaB|nr:tRNA (adenosine(37)-N6)-threonylcarbamoyltransferase complex dimerization subunit type 1 TsaB [Bifidobacteriaceae bacterium]